MSLSFFTNPLNQYALAMVLLIPADEMFWIGVSQQPTPVGISESLRAVTMTFSIFCSLVINFFVVRKILKVRYGLS